ncbi:MAG: PhoX family phosphatase [Prochloraceae cyanobacterium]
MKLKRRNFLLFLGASAGSAVLGTAVEKTATAYTKPATTTISPNSVARAANVPGLSFKPVKVPVPLELNGMSAAQQKSAASKYTSEYDKYEVIDDLVLPDGFTYDVIGAWGDRLGDSRFGYNNDYIYLLETGPNEGLLAINFEYVSGKTWMQTYSQVIGKDLPFEEVEAATAGNQGKINAFALSDSDPLKAKIQEIAKEAFIDQGIGVISIRRNANGKWERAYSELDRRITGISGLEDGRHLKATGPAVTIFTKGNKKGYEDRLGNKIIGTCQNCAGGTTPWGTLLSAEENFQDQVPEPVMADGSSLDPSRQPFVIKDDEGNELVGRGNVFGLAGNKYGWMVEIDPANPNDSGTKHTWLGRFRHEAFGLRAEAGKKLAVYSGCDRRGGHLYKFVSRSQVNNPKSKANSRLLEDGMLYGAKFNADGTGRWIALNSNTPVNPVLPSQVEGKGGIGMVTLPNPNRTKGGIVKVTSDAETMAFKRQFKTLGDLYEGNSREKQGAILIDAHFAANAAGITCTARPEDTIVAEDGTLFVTFTSGSPGGDGGPDKRIFQGPNGESAYEFGWLVRLVEDNNEPTSMSFRWDIFALGGEPTDGGLGFANPDNLLIDNSGNLWVFTDTSTSKLNKATLSRLVDGKPVSTKDLRGIFGNNSVWVIPTRGLNAGNAYPFAIGPMETEITGPCFTGDQETLFLSVQHPGERNGTRQNFQTEVRQFAMRTPTGEEFIQKRKVPVGSNWPGKRPNDPPRPAVVAIRRQDGNSIVV